MQKKMSDMLTNQIDVTMQGWKLWIMGIAFCWVMAKNKTSSLRQGLYFYYITSYLLYNFIHTNHKNKRSLNVWMKGLVFRKTVAPILQGSWMWKYGIIQINMGQTTTAKNIRKWSHLEKNLNVPIRGQSPR